MRRVFSMKSSLELHCSDRDTCPRTFMFTLLTFYTGHFYLVQGVQKKACSLIFQVWVAIFGPNFLVSKRSNWSIGAYHIENLLNFSKTTLLFFLALSKVELLPKNKIMRFFWDTLYIQQYKVVLRFSELFCFCNHREYLLEIFWD